MSLFAKRAAPVTAAELIPPRAPAMQTGTVMVTNDTALRHSAVWACLRLRANLVSTMPVDVFRKVGGINVEVPPSPILVQPGGERVGIKEWLYSTQFDLDRAGNVFGLITERTGFGLPGRIDLVPVSDVGVRIKDNEVVGYRIGPKEYPPDQVWHEKQYTVAGLHVGLSPIAYAAWSIGEYLSIQDFALSWFGGGGIPSGVLKNEEKTLDPREIATIKTRFKTAISNRDLFVTGKDWTYSMIQAEEAGSQWVDAKQFGIADAARFFDCPADLIDAALQSGGDITYQNITQRNLEFLILHLDPALRRREDALTRLIPEPRFVKLNRGVLLEMDPKSQADLFKLGVDSRTLAPSEARAMLDRPPFTEDQLAEFDRLFGAPRTNPAPAANPAAATAVPAEVA